MTLIRHELKQSWKSLAIWTAAIGAFIVTCLLIWPEMKSQMQGISSLFASMGAFTAAFGMDTLDFGTLNGFYGIECGNILGIGGALFAALAGINALAKEEKDGTAELLLTHPMSRARIVTDKLIAVLLQIVALNAVVYLLAIGALAVIGEAIPWKIVSLLHLAYFLYFLNIVANLSDSAKALKYITPFGYAESSAIINSGGLETDKLGIGLALTLAGIGLAYRKYCKKDIR